MQKEEGGGGEMEREEGGGRGDGESGGWRKGKWWRGEEKLF